ncbi:MAG: hypothetical protein JWN01_334 [Patescibacteria group bacterium]|nr:hypothetical protein [Patescibacteria group bacterium]
MSKYLITGTPGSGKSTIIEAFAQRGYTAYDTDNIAGATQFEYRRTGRPVARPASPIDWGIYEWSWQEAKINELLASADTVFLGAVVGNQEKFYPLFDRIFVLTLDEATLSHRLITRTGNDYGKHPDDLQHILSRRQDKLAHLLAAPRAVAIDASPSAEAVADEILHHLPDARVEQP